MSVVMTVPSRQEMEGFLIGFMGFSTLDSFVSALLKVNNEGTKLNPQQAFEWIAQACKEYEAATGDTLGALSYALKTPEIVGLLVPWDEDFISRVQQIFNKWVDDIADLN